MVPDDAFCGCSGLEKVVLADGINEIGKLAFDGCTSLKEVYICGKLNSKLKLSFSKKASGVTIYGKENSKVKEFAEKNGMKFVVFDPDELDISQL